MRAPQEVAILIILRRIFAHVNVAAGYLEQKIKNQAMLQSRNLSLSLSHTHTQVDVDMIE